MKPAEQTFPSFSLVLSRPPFSVRIPGQHQNLGNSNSSPLLAANPQHDFMVHFDPRAEFVWLIFTFPKQAVGGQARACGSFLDFGLPLVRYSLVAGSNWTKNLLAALSSSRIMVLVSLKRGAGYKWEAWPDAWGETSEPLFPGHSAYAGRQSTC